MKSKLKTQQIITVRETAPKQHERLEFNNIYNMDCIDGMRLMSPESIDLIITDPPFAIEFKAKRTNYHRLQSRVLEGCIEIPKENYYDFTIRWMKEAYRLLKKPEVCTYFPDGIVLKIS
jgi:DNA modification methylase